MLALYALTAWPEDGSHRHGPGKGKVAGCGLDGVIESDYYTVVVTLSLLQCNTAELSACILDRDNSVVTYNHTCLRIPRSQVHHGMQALADNVICNAGMLQAEPQDPSTADHV